MNTKKALILGLGVLLAIPTIAPECKPKPQIGEPQNTDQNQTQQESDQLVVYALLDALAVNTRTGTAATVQFARAPQQFE
jgi:hypothetical protein